MMDQAAKPVPAPHSSMHLGAREARVGVMRGMGRKDSAPGEAKRVSRGRGITPSSIHFFHKHILSTYYIES